MTDLDATGSAMPEPYLADADRTFDTVVAAVVERCLTRRQAELNTGWEDALLPFGVLLAGRAWSRPEWIAWSQGWVDHQVSAGIRRLQGAHDLTLVAGEERPGIHLGSYSGDWGIAAVLAAEQRELSGDRSVAATAVCDHILTGSVRGPDGTIHHDRTRRQPWVDTLYYTAAPLARVAARLGRDDYAEEAVRQCLLHAGHLRDPRTGCFFHESEPETGRRSSWLWSRGNGWVCMTFADVLAHCPPATRGLDTLRSLFRELADGLLRLQHPCGLWRIVPENPESHLETSGSAMIGTGLAVGLRAGLLDPGVASSLRRLQHELTEWITPDGRVMGCQTPAGAGGWETHKRSAMGERTYGTGSYLRFAAELRTAGVS